MRHAVAIALFIVISPAVAWGQGVSARFGSTVATFGEDFEVRVEVGDSIGAIDRIEVDVRTPDSLDWITRNADRTERAGWWSATFTSTTVWKNKRTQPDTVELRARLLGRRGGVILMLGEIEPLEVRVLTAPEVAMLQRKLRLYDVESGDESDTQLSGYVGFEGSLGSGSAGRLFIGLSGPVGARGELGGFVSVGPKLLAPDFLTDGGPIVLGFELAGRLYTQAIGRHGYAPYAELFARSDARFPGLDAGAGLRVGASVRLTADVDFDVSLGGAAIGYELTGDSKEFGFAGMVRAAVRFGGPRGEE